MYLKELHLINFKNHEDVRLEFLAGVNAVSGKNGVGKTNLLDAIHYLSMCKSYYTATDQQNIRHDADFFAIHGLFDERSSEVRVSCIQQRNTRKVLKLNQKEYERLADHIGRFPSVMISPYDQDYIQGHSSSRRRYFDSVISQYDRSYLDALMQYNKLLAQRNALLKQAYERGRLEPTDFEIWDERMVLFAEQIYKQRTLFLEGFLPVFSKYFQQLTDGTEIADIQYESSLSTQSLAVSLQQNLQRDYYSGHTQYGVHKDDFVFLNNGFSVRSYCSQGQQKTFLIALKLAQFEYIHSLKKEKPLLLLDDIFDKLDPYRVQCLMRLVAQNAFGQVFLTDTHADRLVEICASTGMEYKLLQL